MGIFNLKKQQRMERRQKDKPKHLMQTTVELLCQNTGKTFRKSITEAETEIICWCKLERWNFHLGAGEGNISADYTNKFGSRPLQKVMLGEKDLNGVAQYDATSGTFIVIDQNKFW